MTIDNGPKGTLYTKDIIPGRLLRLKCYNCMWGKCRKRISGMYTLKIGDTRYEMCRKHFRAWR